MKTTTAIKSFNILDPSVRLHRHYLLEASAGTGKTFTIENMVMRLLAGNEEEPPIPLEEILVVTFTRAATRELIQRIQSKIQDAINDPPASIPSSPKVQENLKTALANFDEAQIFTIHGFCARMLMEYGMDADFGGERIAIDEGLSTGKTQEMVKDFFRSKLRPERYSATQVDAVLRDCHGDIERMISRLERLAQSPLEIEALPSHEESFVFFKEILEGIHASFRFSFDELQGDLLKHLRQFKKTSNRQGELLDEVSRALDVISKLFIKFEYSLEDFEIFLNEGYFLFSLMQEGLRKSRGKILSDAELNYPGLLQVLQNDLFPLLRVSRGTLETIARMGRDCQELLSTVSYEEELFSPDALLASMEKALSNPKFCESIRKRFRFAIIDEFQDTDPTQWKVFSKLFHEEPGQYLYLVGDPKQSIYAFRNADIYTYLNAAKTIGNDLHATLDSNYRSTPELIKALNILFDEETSPHWIPLPRIESRLPYKAVKVPPQPKSEKEFKDNRGAIHFFISSGKGGRTQQWPSDNLEDSQLFPSISNEIISLHKNEDLAFKEIAILVRDRYQLERLSRYLQQRGIPSAARRKSTILDTSIPAEWKVIIQAILNPRDIKMILTALSTRLIAWDYQKIKQFRSQLSSDPFTCEPVIAKFHQLRQLLFKEGFHASFQEFMNSKWLDDKLSVEERLLSTDHYGDAFYTDCYHFAELLSQYQSDHCVQGEGLLHFFTQLSRWQADDDSCIRLRRDSSRDAVTIMTLHMSKGLEYGVVFALGLTNRVKDRDELIPTIRNEKEVLAVIRDKESPEYISYYEEIDAEKMRQLYVGMTRAKYRLYLSVASKEDGSVPGPGCASPLELFLARLDHPAAENLSEVYSRIGKEQAEDLCEFINRLGAEASISCSCTSDTEAETLNEEAEQSKKISPVPRFKLPGKNAYIYSYSALQQQLSKDDACDDPACEQEKMPSLSPPHDFNIEEKSIHKLPSSSDTGTLVHGLFETIPIQVIKEAKSSSDLLVKAKSFFPAEAPFFEWNEVLTDCIYNTFSTALLPDGFRLKDLKPSQLIHEMEFLYPSTSDGSQFLKGFIDLIFSHNDKYYIIDWKTNWLGEDYSAYEEQAMISAMRQKDYYLQAEIYRQALKRTVALFDPRPFEECFGGVLYLFVRGINPSENGNTGVYHFFPNSEIRTYENS